MQNIKLLRFILSLQSKCEKYWPDDINGSKEFNEVTVTLVERHICTDYVKRVMRVEHKVNLSLSYMDICKAPLAGSYSEAPQRDRPVKIKAFKAM